MVFESLGSIGRYILYDFEVVGSVSEHAYYVADIWDSLRDERWLARVIVDTEKSSDDNYDNRNERKAYQGFGVCKRNDFFRYKSHICASRRELRSTYEICSIYSK